MPIDNDGAGTPAISSAELDRFIHTEIMGLCWHEEINNLGCCLKCGQVPEYDKNGGAMNPPYSSDLNAVARAEIKVMSLDDNAPERLAARLVLSGTLGTVITSAIFASAWRRAEACKSEWESTKNWVATSPAATQDHPGEI